MRQRTMVMLGAIAVGMTVSSAWSNAQTDTQPAAAVHDGQHDFDFLLGSWKIHLKRRLKPLTGSDQWVEFDGTVVCRSIWGGLAEVEEFNVDSPEKKIFIQGLAVRLYNPRNRQWTIYWANRKNGVFDGAPQIGHFSNGRGEFYGQDTTEDGRPVYVRFAWSNITSSAPHFEQAYSEDGGRTWEVNWITEQTRVAEGSAPSR